MSFYCIDKYPKTSASWLWSSAAELLNKNIGQNLDPMGDEASLIDLSGIMV